jgi:NAD(P)-dependent dehydrogenase (short-subunit alcohol dehydrogenase family)
MNLDGRVALITGGRRIGAVVATELARGGADVALVYNRSKSEAEETARTIEAVGQRAIILPADLSDPTACQQIVDGTVDRFGRLDVLVNMASVYRSVPFDDITVDIWETQLNVDLRAAWLCARAAAPHMRRLRGGRIINFSDWLTRSGRPRYEGYLTYYVAKAGVAALTEAMALELAKDQILVNAIAPGPIIAPEDTSNEAFAAVERATPLGRWGGESKVINVPARGSRRAWSRRPASADCRCRNGAHQANASPESFARKHRQPTGRRQIPLSALSPELA